MVLSKLLILLFLFFVGSLTGWGIEVFYRKFTKSNPTHKWINPGFLMGPYLPLYGFGLVVLYLLASMEGALLFSASWLNKLALFLFMAVCMTVLEYIAGLIFVRGMHVALWDYSDEWLNLQGIICPKFSLFWALLGAAYYFLIHPHILSALAWFSENVAFSFILGMFYGVLCIDLYYSLQVAAKVRNFAEAHHIQVKYEELKLQIRKSAEEQREKYRFLLAFRSKASLTEHLTRYLDLRTGFISSEIQEKIKRIKH